MLSVVFCWKRGHYEATGAVFVWRLGAGFHIKAGTLIRETMLQTHIVGGRILESAEWRKEPRSSAAAESTSSATL